MFPYLAFLCEPRTNSLGYCVAIQFECLDNDQTCALCLRLKSKYILAHQTAMSWSRAVQRIGGSVLQWLHYSFCSRNFVAACSGHLCKVFTWRDLIERRKSFHRLADMSVCLCFFFLNLICFLWSDLSSENMAWFKKKNLIAKNV